MKKPRHQTNTISWDQNQFQAPDEQPVTRLPSLAVCTRCAAGDCDLCVRSTCRHRCPPSVRRHGVAQPAAGLSHDPTGGF